MIKNLIDISRAYLATLPFMCHQLPERSFYYKGSQFPVCARCTGVIIGQALVLVMFLLFELIISPWVAIASMLPALIDWSLQEYYGFDSINVRRLITGILLGFGYIMLVVTICIFLLKKLRLS
ncbi:putative membrane protein [Leptospira meyeri]|uniref:Putative membrane protein n=1 Tax=Leptospira meyeri TaxID=29508 RepID=A0A4R8MPN4_LEPME|nr:DUF2085 domain-containing protein [Leptospira meyeri]TDY66517.1 putative membrane protein [Leptospira meyeri]